MERVGDYEIDALLREGDLGSVFEAHKGDERVELRVVADGLVRTKSSRKRFLDGVKRLSELEHDRAVAVLAGFEADGKLVVVTESVDAETVGARLLEDGSLPWRRAADIAADIAQALSAAHALEPAIVHGDLRPDQVVLLPGGQIKVAGFGLAQLIEELSNDVTQPIVRQRHLSPEHLETGEATPKSDLYALGLAIYEMLTGEPACKGQTAKEIEASKGEALELPSELRHQVPERLDALVSSLVTLDPDDRPERAADVRKELLEILAKAKTEETPEDDILQSYVDRVTRLSSQRASSIKPEELREIALELGMSESDLAAADEAAEAHMARGEGYLEHQLWDDAIEQLSAAVAFSPMRVEVVFMLAQAYHGRWQAKHKKADCLEAQRLARRCVELDPHHSDAFKMLAELEGELDEHFASAKDEPPAVRKTSRKPRKKTKSEKDLSFGQMAAVAAIAALLGSALLLYFDPLGGIVFYDTPATTEATDSPTPSPTPTPSPMPPTDPTTPALLSQSHTSPQAELLKLVEAGSTLVGSPDGVGEPDERPQRSLMLDAFYMHELEVSVTNFQACVQSGACSSSLYTTYSMNTASCNYGAPGRDGHPMNCVSAQGAESYCAWLSSRDPAITYRLPTEAEWEKAARGASAQRYPSGDSVPGCTTTNLGGCSRSGTSPTGAYPLDASPAGIRDMAGNVSEWTLAVYEKRVAPERLVPGAAHSFAIRGGNWNERTPVRAADRDTVPMPLGTTGIGAQDIGFRCVAVAP